MPSKTEAARAKKRENEAAEEAPRAAVEESPEEAAPEEELEKTYRITRHAAVGDSAVFIGGKQYFDGMVVSQEEYDRIKGAKGPATYEHPNGVPLITGKVV